MNSNPLKKLKLIAHGTAAVCAGVALSSAHATEAISAPVIGCLITPARTADLGVSTAGVVDRVFVDRGDQIRKGQALVVLKSEPERASLVSAEVRAGAQSTTAAARANFDLASSKLERAQELYRLNFVSKQAVDQAVAERDVAEQTLKQSLEQHSAQVADVQLAKAVLATRTLRSPFDGVVVDRMVQPGERVELQPMLRVAEVNSLKVEIVVAAAHFGALAPGMGLAVQPELPGFEPRRAVITQVDQVLDAASNTFRVRLALSNDDGRIPAGARCKVSLQSLQAVAP